MFSSKNFKSLSLGLVWTFIFYLCRNFFFQFNDVAVVLVSFALGLLVHKLPRRSWHWMVFISLTFPSVNFFFILVDSSLPFILGYYTWLKSDSWRFYLLYLLMPLGLVADWIYSSEDHSYRIKMGEIDTLDLVPLQDPDNERYQLSADSIYFISYWHLGCRSCLIQDRALKVFEYRNQGKPIKILSVFLGDSTDHRFKPTVALFHQHFSNYFDRSEFVQNQFQQNMGPALLLYKDGSPQKLWHGFTRDTWEARFMPYYWQWYADN